MFSKLAFRNVKRQIGNYLIYFITVSLTVALMFAVNSAIFSRELMEKASAIQELRAGLIALTVFVSLIVAFVLGYATSFMLKLRKREFGTYLTLGMTRKNILSVFLLESSIIFRKLHSPVRGYSSGQFLPNHCPCKMQSLNLVRMHRQVPFHPVSVYRLLQM